MDPPRARSDGGPLEPEPPSKVKLSVPGFEILAKHVEFRIVVQVGADFLVIFFLVALVPCLGATQRRIGATTSHLPSRFRVCFDSQTS